MRITILTALAAAFVVLALPRDAVAYIGPGAGLTVIGTVLGVLAALVLAVVGFAWYPLKRLTLRLRSASMRRDGAQG